MKIIIMSWNVRIDVERRKVIKTLIKLQRVDLVFLQETRFKTVLVRSIEVEDLQTGLLLRERELRRESFFSRMPRSSKCWTRRRGSTLSCVAIN